MMAVDVAHYARCHLFIPLDTLDILSNAQRRPVRIQVIRAQTVEVRTERGVGQHVEGHSADFVRGGAER